LKIWKKLGANRMFNNKFSITFILLAMLSTGSIAEEFTGVTDQIGLTKGRIVNPTFTQPDEEEQLNTDLPGKSNMPSSQSVREELLAKGMEAASESMLQKENASSITELQNRELKSKIQARLKTTRTLEVDSGENRILTVSKGQLNRVITPFSNPVIMDSSRENESTLFSVDNVIYFGSNSSRPIGVYVSPDGDPSISLSLTFSNDPSVGPENQDEEQPIEEGQDLKAKEFEKVAASKYHDWIKAFSLDLANGNMPPGYSLSNPTSSMHCSMKNIHLQPMQLMKGSEFFVEIYKASNKTSVPQVIIDQACHAQNVKFVMPWPTHLLEPGDEVELFVVKQQTREEFNKRPRFIN
jgi:hypothetical protein